MKFIKELCAVRPLPPPPNLAPTAAFDADEHAIVLLVALCFITVASTIAYSRRAAAKKREKTKPPSHQCRYSVKHPAVSVQPPSSPQTVITKVFDDTATASSSSWQDNLLEIVLPCLQPPNVHVPASSTTSPGESSEEEDEDSEDATSRRSSHDPNRLWCECIGEHVVALHWPRIAADGNKQQQQQNEDDALDADLMRDYEEAVRLLSARTTPFGLVHDFRAVEKLSTLTPIVGKILPDAIAISKSGLVKRVCLLHSFKSLSFRFVLESLIRLSPVRPSKMFHADHSSKGIAWAAAWIKQE